MRFPNSRWTASVIGPRANHNPAAATAPIFAYALAGTDTQGFTFAAACALLSFVLYFKHWQNIRRLWSGTEPKIGSEKKAG